MLARAQITIRDENDIHVASSAPASPATDALWLDTSATPAVLKRWNGAAWNACGADPEDVAALSERVTTAESGIEQNAQSIALKVSKGEIVSQINQSAEAVSISAGKIDLNGVVTANGKFRILQDGSMEAVDGKFSGDLTADVTHCNGLQLSNGYTFSLSGETEGDGLQFFLMDPLHRANIVTSGATTRMGLSAEEMTVIASEVIYLGLASGPAIVMRRDPSVPQGGGPVVLNNAGDGHGTLGAPDERWQAVYARYIVSTLPVQPRNLLDNSDFRNPVNQRGLSSYTGNVYTIDRWKQYSATTTLGTGGITLSSPGAGGGLYQKIEGVDATKAYTLALLADDGLYVASGTGCANTNELTLTITNGVAQFSILKTSHALYWAALYEGAYTADTLPPYQPKGYGAELLECMRYYQVIKDFAYGYYTDSIQPIYFPIALRSIPTVTGQVMDFTNTIELPFGIAPANKNGVIYVTATGVITGKYYRVTLYANADIL